MDRSRLKNVIIVILALLNAFLMISLIMQRSAERATHRRLEEQLILLFSADGMTMQEGVLPREEPPAALTMSRDAVREQKAAAFFLGETVTGEEQGGGAVLYTGENGTAVFREDGSFEVSGTLSVGEADAVCRGFCKTFSYGEPTFLLNSAGDGTASAAGVCDGRRVVGGGVTFRVEGGVLTGVSGTLLPEEGSPASADTKMLSAVVALTEFQKTRRETGAVVSAVTEVALCYRLQRSAAAPMMMVPAWCIVTDTSTYYVSCMTGSVTTD